MSDEASVHVEGVDEVEAGPVEETLDEAASKLWCTAVKTGTWDPADIDLSEDKEQYEQGVPTRPPTGRAWSFSWCSMSGAYSTPPAR